ncbi:MAG: hypothetical protein F6J87_29370 [Spirulina sp. SIO3F2]|nr:hypothetical protein [Spirulina sp. SIO3F2]
MDQLFKAILCFSNFILLAGIIGASLNQSDRAFDLSFWFSLRSPPHPPPHSAPTALIDSQYVCDANLLNPNSGD